MNIVKPKDLIFPLERLDGPWYTITLDSGGDNEKKIYCHPKRLNIIQRWMARNVAASILNSSESYQFGGYAGIKSREYLLIDADRHQLAHWILRNSGYVCCCADLMKITGTEES